VHAYSTADWESFFVAVTGAAAALFAVTLWNTVRYQRQNPDSPLYWSVARMTANAVATVPGMLAGISLAARWGGGFYWLTPTALLGIAGAVFSSWILLVEIVP
jgi:uncharacterized membrane protein YeaQ/YmgE (transglycosylase-associated protein family)